MKTSTRKNLLPSAFFRRRKPLRFIPSHLVLGICLISGMLLQTQMAHATVFTAITTGDWDDGSTWNQSGATPGASDNVIIGHGCSVTVDGTSELAQTVKIGVDDDGDGALFINASSTLTVSATITAGSDGGGTVSHLGSLIMRSGGTLSCGALAKGGSNLSSFQMNNGTVVFTGNSTMPTISAFNNLTINASGNTLTVANNVTVNGNFTITAGTFDNSGNSLNVKGNFANSGTYTNTGGGTLFSGTGAQAISGASSTTFASMQITNTSGAVSASASITVEDAFTVDANAVYSPGASVTVGGAGTLTGAGTINVSATGNGDDLRTQYAINSITYTNLTVAYTGASTQALGSGTFNNLLVNGSGFTMGGDITLEGTLDLTAGALNINGNTLRLNGNILSNGGSITGSSSSNIIVGDAGSAPQVTLPSINGGLQNLELDRANGMILNNDQTGGNRIYGNLTITSGTMLQNRSITVDGNVTGSGTIQLTSARDLTLKGDLTVGTYDANGFGGTLYLKGTGTQTVGSGNDYTFGFFRVQGVGGTVTLASDITVKRYIRLEAGTLEAGSRNISIEEDFYTNGGTFSAGTSSVVFNGFTGGQELCEDYPITFYNLRINTSGGSTNMEQDVTVNGELAGYGTLNPGSHSLFANGNITISGLNAGSATITLAGSSTQAINASSYANLVLNNSAGFTLAGNVTVTGALTMTRGKVTLGSSNFTFASGATIPAGTASTYLLINSTGRCKANNITTATLPIGDDYTPVTITNGGGANYTVGVVNSVTDNGGSPTLTAHAVAATWDIQVSGTVSNVGLEFGWPVSAQLGSFDPLQCFIGTRTSTTGTWAGMASPSAAGGTDPHTQSATMTSMTNGTTYYFGVGDASSPLPVTLVSFDVKPINNTVQLDWTTASEINNSHFAIERSSNGNIWSTIGRVEGNGNSNVIQHYHAIDNLMGIIPNATLYYRLKQVDFNGKFEYSPIRSVNLNAPHNTVDAYPNPVNHVLNINIANAGNTSTTIEITQASGTVIYNETISGNAIQHRQIDMDAYPAGTYIMRTISGNDVKTQMVYKY